MAELTTTLQYAATTADLGAKVASRLWSFGASLESAGSESRAISKGIELLSKAMELIYTELEQQTSSSNQSLLEDLMSTCDERIHEAKRLIETLEAESNLNDEWNITTTRIQFILQKSTFSLLQQDIDSLHNALNLFSVTLAYSRIVEGQDKQHQLQDQIVNLMRDVKQDQDGQSASSVVRAAVLSMRFDNESFDPHEPTSTAVLSNRETQEDNDEDTSMNSLENIVPGERSDVNNNDSSIPPGPKSASDPLTDNPPSPDMMGNDRVLEALTSFVQLQIVQKKTLRWAEKELARKNNVQRLPSPKSARPEVTHAVAPTNTKAGHTSRNSSDSGKSSPSSDSDVEVNSSLPPDLDKASLLRLSHFGVAKRHPGQYFIYKDCRATRLWVSFELLRTFDLGSIILAYNSLDYRPPKGYHYQHQRRRNETSTEPIQYDNYNNNKDDYDDRFYRPPPRQTRPTFYNSNKNTSKKQWNEWKGYVLEYAHWYTNQHKLAALQARQYRFKGGPDVHTLTDYRIVTFDRWTSWIRPGYWFEVEFDARPLVDLEWGVVRDGPYREDLQLIIGQEVRDSSA